MILGLNQAHHVNMRKEREKIKMLSVNQMLVYHTVMEAYNITNKKASDQLQKKFMHEGKHSERSAANNEMYVPEKTLKRCTGFSYIGPKLYNMIPKDIKEAKTTMTSKPTERDGYGRTSTNHLTIIKIDKDLYIYMCIAV